ncbi:MAG: hypothetical protein SYC29_12205 [Planctomycetota bacterium]|nr:hypothetical protein [Planctomycetota bacterium]
MTRDDHHQRIELLIAPRDVMHGRCAATLLEALGQTLTAPRCSRFTCGAEAITCLAEDDVHGDPPGLDPAPMRIVEGLWPEPLGLRLTVAAQAPHASWRVESDRYGVRPIFYAFDSARRPIVSTRPELVAAIIGAPLSRRSIAEHLLVNYNLDDHTPFEDVHRLRPGECLVMTKDNGLDITSATCPAVRPGDPAGKEPPWLEPLTETVARALQRGDALELTGGVDSRLVLALALHAGVRPDLAFTLGNDDDEDVRLARMICRRFGIRHLALPVVVEERTIISEAHRFVTGSGFASNACAYGWLPGVFDRLSDRRTGQVGGCGGEFGTGIRCPSLDCGVNLPLVRRWWVRLRLIDTATRLDDLFGRDEGRRLNDQVEQTLLAAMQRRPDTHRARFDGFYLDHYLTQRMPMASGGVLVASAGWYRPLQPFMHGAYIEWGRALSTKQCADRALQTELVTTLAPQLAGLSYAGGRGRRRPLMKAVGKARRRWRRRGAAADMGAPSVADALARRDAVRHSLRDLPDRIDGALRAESIEEMLANPPARARELGVLISAAWAAEAAGTLARRLRADRDDRPRRRAA